MRWPTLASECLRPTRPRGSRRSRARCSGQAGVGPLPSAPMPTLRAAVIGAGPAGFYTAEQLLKVDFAVDLYDALPTPFGLVRAGVAPDHPKIKSVTRAYEKTAAKPGFRFFGGVEL